MLLGRADFNTEFKSTRRAGVDLLHAKLLVRRELVEAAGDGDAGLAEGVGHLRFSEARGVVFE